MLTCYSFSLAIILQAFYNLPGLLPDTNFFFFPERFIPDFQIGIGAGYNHIFSYLGMFTKRRRYGNAALRVDSGAEGGSKQGAA
jgi:hypothetical protein